MEASQQEYELDEHDTIDVEDEIGDIDALLAEDTVPVPEPRGRGVVELLLVGVANAIWGVVGLVLWPPQALRAVLGAALRVIHSALTNQRSDRAAAGIRSVSGLYFDRFLRRHGEPTLVGRRHELRPLRLVGEIFWVGGFYLLVLRWLAPSLFGSIWARLTAGWHAASTQTTALALRARDWVSSVSLAWPEGRWQEIGALAGVALVAALLGFWLGRRRRRRADANRR